MQKLILCFFALLATQWATAKVTRHENAVVVDRGGLIHTTQLLNDGPDDLLQQLQRVLGSDDAKIADVAKLNIYATESSAAQEFLKLWEGPKPSVTIALGSLPGDAKIACDAVIATDRSDAKVARFSHGGALMPAGRDILYLSGRAASGELAEATSGTMTQLFDILKQLGSTPADVVQVKAFIKPMSGWETVKGEIAKSFGDVGLPPLVMVEWTSPSRATEIELIAAAPDQRDTEETVSYYTPPGDKASPVFSRVARVHGDKLVYIDGVAADEAGDPEKEVHGIYAKLKSAAESAGSDLNHFAKATYYVSDNEVSGALNALRPDYYDPKRPPAASKIQVADVGVANRGMVIDMIAAQAAAAGTAKAASEGEWIQLFNGKDLTGWTPKIRYEDYGEDAKNTFRVENGAIVARYDQYDEFNETFGHLFYKEPFSHYHLRSEYRFVGEQCKGGPGWALRNSGFMLHCQDPKTMSKDQDFPVSIEAQILAGDGVAPRTTMNLCTPGCHVVMKDELVKRHCIKSTSDTFHGDQWVTAEMIVRGDGKVTHIINGKVVLEYEKPILDDTDASAKSLLEAGAKIEMSSGWISLQSESHPVEFRKVEIKKLAE